MPKSGTTSYRRYVNLTCPTPGATIYYTFTDDKTEPADPTTSSKAYNPAAGYFLFDNPNNSKTGTKYYTLKAIAVKDGMAASAVQTFTYYITRPLSAPFEARLVHAPTSTSPSVWDIFNPSDYNRPHVYYIEGSKRGVVMDAGQYSAEKGGNLKAFIDGLATKPYDAVLGHNNPDHVEQINSFVQTGIKLYMTPQDKGSVLASKRADFIAAANASVPIHDGDVLDLGNVQMTAYQAPGHSNGQVILQDKKNGWIFGSDMFGCNRPATADITNYSGAKMDLFLSMVQQLYMNLRKNGGRIEEVYNAHNEVPVGYAGIKNFEAAVQQLIDIGDSATVPSMRGTDPGGNPRPAQRTSVVGDMWRDKNWIALWVGGNYGTPVTYLTPADPNWPCNNKIDYNAADGIKKYSVLSNIEIANGDLVGVDLTWAPPSNNVPNTLPNKFDPWTYAYDIKVPAANNSITVTPKAMSNRITSMKLNGVAIKSGTSKSMQVAEGTQIKIEIVAPDKVTTSQYVFTVRKN
jgi:glyoxylase-like metal-dependent hydrolase (beta-lactamase superfamily II)